MKKKLFHRLATLVRIVLFAFPALCEMHINGVRDLPFNRSKIKLNLIAAWSLAFSRASFDSALPLVRRDHSLCTDWPLHILSLILDLKLSVNVIKVYLYLHSQNARTLTFSSVINPAGI